MIAKHLGEEAFDSKLVVLCMAWLQDEVFSIRQAATDNFQKLTTLFGEEWARAKVFEKVSLLYQDSNVISMSLHRLRNLA